MTPDYQVRSDGVRRAFPAAGALRDLRPSVAQHGALTLVRLHRH